MIPLDLLRGECEFRSYFVVVPRFRAKDMGLSLLPKSERALCQRQPSGKGLGSQLGWHLAGPHWHRIPFPSFCQGTGQAEIASYWGF